MPDRNQLRFVLIHSWRPQPARTGRSWLQEYEAAAHIIYMWETGNRETNVSAQLALSVVCIMGLMPMEWYHPQVR